jgi:predicted metal-binding membrane protein
MMAAMMLPGSAPMIAAFATINRSRRARGAPAVATAIFLAGYLIVWTGFSALATGMQWLLQASGLVTTMMQSASYYFSAVLFFAAGAYQFSPLKQRCMTHCRSPDGFILSEWRDGATGALVMGFRHGLYCTGCCIGLMLLLFAVAVMDLRWVAALAVLVTAEKLLPRPRFWRMAIGIALIAVGAGFAAAGGEGAMR